MLIQYPNLWAYARDIYQTRNIGSTVDMRHIVSSYYVSKMFCIYKSLEKSVDFCRRD